MEKFVFDISLEKALLLLSKQCMLIIKVRSPQRTALRHNGNTATSSHHHLSIAAFTLTAESDSCNRERSTRSSKKPTLWPFTKTLPNPDDNVHFYRITYSFCFSYKDSLSQIFLSMLLLTENFVIHISLFYLQFFYTSFFIFNFI